MSSMAVKNGSNEKFAQQMKLGLFSKEFSDVKFVVGDQKKIIYGHRIIIGLRCALLQKLFQESASRPEVPIVLSDVNPDTFQQMLDFMYTNTVQISQNSAMDLLGTAIEYGLQDLQAVVSEYITENLDVDFAANALHAAVYFEVAHLETKCLRFIAQNAQAFLKSKSYLDMGEQAFIKVMDCDDLQVDEVEVNKAIFEWGKNGAVKTGTPLKLIVARVVLKLRIAIFDVELLENIERFSESEGDYIPPEMFQFAWKFHAQIKNGRSVPIEGKSWATLRKGTKALDHHQFLNPYME